MSDNICIVELIDENKHQALLEGKPTTCGMRAGRVTLQPGQSCSQHSTNDQEETLIFLTGKGNALIGDDQKPFEVGKGKIAYIAPHTLHSIKNTGETPLVYIYCVAPIQ